MRLFAIACVLAGATALVPPTVVVSGATGNTGRRVVSALLRDGAKEVRALVRNATKAAAALPDDPRIDVRVVDLEDPIAVTEACVDADAAIWCATGIAKEPKTRRFAKDRSQLIDEVALPVIADAVFPGPVAMLSSAGVTRPAWKAAKQKRFVKAFDIPIVRLNPMGILGLKVLAEKALAKATPAYTVVRPVGLNDDWPAGRPVLAQGDVAVGRSNRDDVADVLVAALAHDSARGKTFEMLSLRGYEKPASLEASFAALKPGAPPREAEAAASYALLQQLLPGVEQDPTRLEMGRSYEQVDAGTVNRAPGAAPTDREKAVAAAAGAGLGKQ